LDLSLELCDSLALSPRLAVHGVLEALDELLEVSDPVLEGTDVGGVRARR